MNVRETTDIRELTAAELNEVTGGLVDPVTVSVALGAACVLGAYILGWEIGLWQLRDRLDSCRRLAIRQGPAVVTNNIVETRS